MLKNKFIPGFFRRTAENNRSAGTVMYPEKLRNILKDSYLIKDRR